MVRCRRRTVLSTVGTGSLVGMGVGASTATASESILRGQLVDHAGEPIANRRVELGTKESGGFRATTDREGRFAQEVPSNTKCRIGFYEYKYGPQPSEPNGIPHVCSLGRHSTGTGETELGELRAEKAHLVEVRALDADGNPVGNADARLYAQGSDGDYWGTGPNSLATNHNGFIVVDDMPYTGIELVNSVDFSIAIPNGNGAALEYSREFFVEEPLAITAQIGEGLTIESRDASAAPRDATPEETDETTAASSDSSDETSDASDETADTSESDSEAHNETAATSEPAPDTQNETDESTEPSTGQQRGFFSNDPSEDELELLSDPFTLTVGGFVLSAGGVAYQLIRGH